MEELARIEGYAENLYNSTDPTLQKQSEEALRFFFSSAEAIPKCQFILDNSQQPFSLLLASSSLLRLITEFWTSFNKNQTLEMRNYLLNYLATKCNIVPQFVNRAIIQVICRISKLDWKVKSRDEDEDQNSIVPEIIKFLQHTVDHCITGLGLLSELVDEMNIPRVGHTFTRHRQIACSFRDTSLKIIFQLALTSLRQIIQGEIQTNDKQQSELRKVALSLTLKCLSFDYIGTNPDESAEDIWTIQIPSNWREIIEKTPIVRLIFQLFASWDTDSGSMCLQILVQLASCRRSFFTDDNTRIEHLSMLFSGSLDILKNTQSITDSDCYLHFCRLLGRLKANFLLSELLKMQDYAEWLNCVTSFTIDAFQRYAYTSHSLHYLIGLWARLATAIPYLRGELPTFLNQVIPQVTQSFITAKINAVEANLEQMGNSNPAEFFDDIELEPILKHMSTLCRYQYSATSGFFKSIILPLTQRYKECVQLLPTASTTDSSNSTIDFSSSPGKHETRDNIVSRLILLEAQFSLMLYMIGSVILGYNGGIAQEDQETIDAELCALVYQVIRLVEETSQNLNYPKTPLFDVACLHFFQDFRKSFIGPSSTSLEGIRVDPPIYEKLQVHLGPTDQQGIIALILGKIVSTLRCWPQNKKVVDDSLSLLNALSSGYSSSKLLASLDMSQDILLNHSDKFPFLNAPGNLRARTAFYSTLGHLIFEECNFGKFDIFMKPFDTAFDFLNNQSNYRNQNVQQIGIGLCRDLRGVVSASSHRQSYDAFFEWLYPKNFRLILRLLETFPDVPQVTTSVLKFIYELVWNKAQRIQFESSSPNGILLFRETSRVLETYGNRFLRQAKDDSTASTTIQTETYYKQRVKGLSVCMGILKNALSGGYVNFGIFQLYRDKALSSAITTVLQMILIIPMIQLLISLAANAIDSVITYLYYGVRKKNPPKNIDKLKNHLDTNKDITSQILSKLFNELLFGKVDNHWTLARPVLSIIVTHEPLYVRYKENLFLTQPPEVRIKLEELFTNLMKDVTNSLQPRVRDTFCQNLLSFRNKISEFAVKPTNF